VTSRGLPPRHKARTPARPSLEELRKTVVTDATTSKRMAGIRTKNTSIELRVREVLRSRELHYRTRNKDLPGAPDIANRTKRWAVFVHGCFWHGHPGCPRASIPKRNADFWKQKLETNRARDARVAEELTSLGYRVVVVWGCETSDQTRLLALLKVLLPQSP
jgi:DNA mismatch endonuclease Vsr